MKLVDRKTGAIVDVPDEQAQAAYMSGQFGIPKGAPMPVKTPGLAAGTVDAPDAAAAFEAGARPATEGEYRSAQAEGRYGGIGGAIEAGAVGAARGAASTFGVPLDAAAIGLAEMGNTQTVFSGRHEVDPYRGERDVSAADALRERLGGLQEVHPYASVAGELAGMVGASALGGGVLGRAGAAGEALGGTAGRFAAEGGVIGGISAVNEAALGDERVTAAKVLAGVGHGALVGGALGGAMHLGTEAVAGMRDRFGRWIGSLRPKDIEAVAEKNFGYAPKGLGEKVQEEYARVSSSLSGKDADVIAKFTELSPEGAAARRVAVFDAPKIQEDAERAVRHHVDELMSAGDLVSSEARGGLKAGYVKSAVMRGNEAEVQAFASQKLGTIIEGAEAQLGEELAPSMAKSVETVSKLAYRAQEAIASGDNAQIFVALDNVKRGVQKLTSTGYRSLRMIADPVDQLNAKRTVAWLDGAAADLRTSLENEEVWGKAAIDQREINAAWSKQIDASKRFHNSLTTEVGRDPNNPYLQVRGADPAKISGYVKGLTNPNNDLTHQAVRDYVSSTKELSEAISKSYDLSPEKLAEVSRVKGAAEAFGKTINEAETTLVTANQYRQLLDGPEGGTVASALGTAGAILGGLPGGILGTIAGAAIHAARQPGKVIAQMAAIERLASKVDNDITKGVSSFLSGKAPKGALPKPASVEILESKLGERAAFESKVQEVRRLAANKDELTSRITEFTSQFDTVAPNIAGALTLAAVKGVDYLAAYAPPGFQPRPEALAWGLDEPPLYTDAEMRSWARRAAVVNNPLVAVESMRRNMLTPEEVDALKNVHGPIYEQLQREVQMQRTSKRTPLNYGRALQIELMFDVPLNRTLDRDFMRTVQQSFAVPEPKAPRPRVDIGSSRSSSSRTTAQELAGGMK